VKRPFAWLLIPAVLCLLTNGLIAQSGPPAPPGSGGDHRRGGGPPQPTPEERERFRQRLGITVRQQEQMDALFADSDRQRKALSKRLWELFDQRRQVTDVYDFDRARERAIRKDLEQVNSQILKLHWETEEKLRRILNREQFDRLRELRAEMMRSFRDRRNKPGNRSGFGEKKNEG
jgi:Spy/CpxP family protein refolding chaperone